MDKRMFIDVHVIQSVPPSCINRDDTGSPKTCTYGGARRARVSSQSWKNATRSAMRNVFTDNPDNNLMGVRTKNIVRLISERIRAVDPNISEENADTMAVAVLSAGGVKAVKNKKTEVIETGALFFISNTQVEALAKLAIDGNLDKKTVQTALNSDKAVDIALFGRMVADDPTLNSDASVQVAHAISTHKVDPEYDYYTAVDDCAPEDNAGAAMIGTVEFDSATLYRYSTLSVHDLLRELQGNKKITSLAVTEFIRSFVLSMPTGKMNSFANRTLPYAVLITLRKDQPVNLVSAFEMPVPAGQNGGHNSGSVKALVKAFADSQNFVSPPVKTWQIGLDLEAIGPSQSLDTVIAEIGSLLGEDN